MSRAYILFITGTSGSGKTTLYESLRSDKDLNGVEFHDIDENGVPTVGSGPWRKYRVENLLYEAAQRQKNGISTVVCGIALPHEILESKYYKPSCNVHILLIETSPKQIRERLKSRIDEHTDKGIFDESFNRNSRRDAVESNLKLRLILRNSVEALRRGHRIDASKLSEEELYRKTKEVIEKVMK